MIPLHLIETFIVYSESQNLAKTAKILGQTQPSASRQIVQFQKFFKKSLFFQNGQSKKLSLYGQEVCNYYKDSIVNLRQLRSQFDGHSIQDRKEVLSLAARSEILQRHIAKLNFQSNVELITMSGPQIQDALSQSQLDMAVYQENFETYNYFRKKLFSSSWSVIIPRTWKVDNKAITSLDRWLDASPLHPFASYDKQNEFLTRNKLKSFNLPRLNTQFIANDWRLLTDKVINQKCWAIVPSDYTDSSQCVHMSLSQHMKDTQFYVYFRKDLAKNEDVKYLIDQLS